MVAKEPLVHLVGNPLVRQDVDPCYLVNKTNGKETNPFGINDINQWIAPTKDSKGQGLFTMPGSPLQARASLW